jgi:hypothetical protein
MGRGEVEGHERTLMQRAIRRADLVAAFLEQSWRMTPAEVDLLAVGLMARAAHREPTPEARLCELQAMVRRWARAASGRELHGSPALPASLPAPSWERPGRS